MQRSAVPGCQHVRSANAPRSPNSYFCRRGRRSELLRLPWTRAVPLVHREESSYVHHSRPFGEYRPAPLISLRHALRTPRALAGGGEQSQPQGAARKPARRACGDLRGGRWLVRTPLAGTAARPGALTVPELWDQLLPSHSRRIYNFHEVDPLVLPTITMCDRLGSGQ